MLFKNKFRVEPTRLKNFDYSVSGYYFVTICTKNHEYFFGDIINGRIDLNDIGNIIDDEWKKTFILRPDIIADEYCIMPDHFHTIIHVTDNSDDLER